MDRPTDESADQPCNKTCCMVVHSHYPADPRVRREAEALLDEGWVVDIVCLRGKGERPTEKCGGATVHRLPWDRHRGHGPIVYLFEYVVFFLLAVPRVTWLHLRRRYGVVQVHNMPDFIVFTALLPRLLGARVVLDVHDLVPELYSLRFGGSASHPVVRITRWVEGVSVAFADHVVTAGEPFRRRLTAGNLPADKVTVVMNSADPRLFRPDLSTRTGLGRERGFVLMYHGGLFDRYGLDIAIKAVGRLRDRIPGLRFRVLGEGEAEDDLRRLVEELDLAGHVEVGGFVPIDEIASVISAADLGVVPYRQNHFTDLLYPTKAFEYLTVGVPVIVSRTAAMEEMFGDVPDMFFQPGDVDDLAARILVLYEDSERTKRLLDASREAYAPYTWESQRERYLAVMHRLAA